MDRPLVNSSSFGRAERRPKCDPGGCFATPSGGRYVLAGQRFPGSGGSWAGGARHPVTRRFIGRAIRGRRDSELVAYWEPTSEANTTTLSTQ